MGQYSWVKIEAMELRVCNGYGEWSAMEFGDGLDGIKCNGFRGNGYRN